MEKSKEIKQIYHNGYAKMSNFKYDFRLFKVMKLAEKFVPSYPERILDVGCGDGYFTQELGEKLKAKEIYGIDFSPNAAEEAIRRNIKAQALDIDEADLPFESDYFDFIYCGGLIELVLDPDHLLIELARVLSKDGRLIITFPNLGAWASRIAVLLGFQPYFDLVSRRYEVGKMFIQARKLKKLSKGFVRLYTARSFKQLAGMYGLRIIKFYGAGESSMPVLLHFLDRIASRAPSLAFHVIGIGKKEA